MNTALPTSHGMSIHRIMHEKAIVRCTLMSKYESQASKAHVKVYPQMGKLLLFRSECLRNVTSNNPEAIVCITLIVLSNILICYIHLKISVG